MRLYHGGPPGMKVGDTISPRPAGDDAHLVDGCPTCEARRASAPLEDDDCDSSMIYVTTDRDYASIYANGYPRGAIYTVIPDGPTAATGDASPSWACASATITGVVDPLVKLSAHDFRRFVRRYTGVDVKDL